MQMTAPMLTVNCTIINSAYDVNIVILRTNECEALPGVAYPGVQDNRSTLNTKTGYE